MLLTSCPALDVPTTRPCRDVVVADTPRSPADDFLEYLPFALCAVAVGAVVWALVRRRHSTAFAVSLLLALGFLLF